MSSRMMINIAPSSASSFFDLETYIHRYAPHSETRLQRLLFIASSTSDNKDLTKTAFSMAERHLKEMMNVKKYCEVFAGKSGGKERGSEMSSGDPSAPWEDGFVYDAYFVRRAEALSDSQLSHLEANLSTAQNLLNKESIRSAYLALGEFHRDRGDLRDALRRVLRARDYCTNARQTAEQCLLVLELGVDLRNYQQVRDYVYRAEHNTSNNSSGDVVDALFGSKLKVASGLVLLAEKRYGDAACKFVSVSADLGGQFNTVISGEDIALYGALLALATMDRGALQTNVLDSAGFKGRLELVPPLRDALRHYVRAEYGTCLGLLEGMRSTLLLDLHLHGHVEELLLTIRDKCIVQYFKPYSVVSLHTMGACFGLDVETMESVVVDLISKGKILGARINSLEKVLKAQNAKNVERRRRNITKRKVVKLGDDFLRETESMIMRLSCLEQDIVVRSTHQRSNWRGGGGGGSDEFPGSRYGGRSGGRGGHDGSAYDNTEYCSDDDGIDTKMMDMENPEEV